MQLKAPLVAAAGLMLFASAAQAQNARVNTAPSAEIALSNETLLLRYLTGGEKVGAKGSRGFADIFLSEERDIVLSGGLLFPIDVEIGPFSALVGPRALVGLLQDENDDVLAAQIGAELRLDIHRNTGFAVVGQAWYSPDVLTFGSADNVTDLSARAEIRIAPRMIAFGGFRWFEFDLTEGRGTSKLQDELFLGVNWRL